MPHVAFDELDDAEAERLCRAYVAGASDGVAWLRDRSELELPPTRDGLVEVWTWFLGLGEEVANEPADRLPVWYLPDPPGAQRRFSRGILRLIDAIGYYFAEVLQTDFPHLEWKRYWEPPEDNMADQNQPVLTGSGLTINPRQIAHTIVGRSQRGRASDALPIYRQAREPDALARAYDVWYRNLRELMSR